MKLWLTTLAEQLSLSALPVVDENLDERMTHQHVLGEERRRVLRNGGCGSRTGANDDRMHHLGFNGSAIGAADQADCLDLHGSAAAYARSCRCCKLKEQLTLVCEEVSKMRDRSGIADGIGYATTVALFTCRCTHKRQLFLEFAGPRGLPPPPLAVISPL